MLNSLLLGTGAIIGIIVAVVVVILIIAVVAWWIKTRNGFVRLKNRVEEAWATIDVYLKKRFDLIPNLVETVKGYADYAKETAEYIKEMVDGFESTADGDMRKTTYDTDKNGVVDDAEKLGGELPEAYRKKADKIALADVENALTKDWLTGTFPASGWAENGGNWVQTIAADLNPETDDVQIDIALPAGEGKQEALDAWSNLYDFEMGNQTLTAKWFEKPEVDITVKILRWREVK